MFNFLKKGFYNSIIIIATFFLAGVTLKCSAEKIIDYGFEDYTGDFQTTPGYIFSYPVSYGIDRHYLNTEVIQNCEGRLAYEGNYYFHQNFYPGEVDPCLGTQPGGVGAYNVIYFNHEFENDTLVVRYYFRVTGDWPNAGVSDLKFMRVTGTSVVGNYTSAMNRILDDGVTCGTYDPMGTTWSEQEIRETTSINWNDGEWHSAVGRFDILNKNNVADNMGMSLWLDDWDMQGEPDCSLTIFLQDYANNFNQVILNENWNAAVPTSNMGMDFDKVEIWDGLPTSEPADTTPPANPSGLSVI